MILLIGFYVANQEIDLLNIVISNSFWKSNHESDSSILEKQESTNA